MTENQIKSVMSYLYLKMELGKMMKADRFTKKEIKAIIEPRYLVIVEEMLNDIKNDFMLDLMQFQ